MAWAGEEPEADTQRELFGATIPHLSPDLLPEVEIE